VPNKIKFGAVVNHKHKHTLQGDYNVGT